MPIALGRPAFWDIVTDNNVHPELFLPAFGVEHQTGTIPLTSKILEAYLLKLFEGLGAGIASHLAKCTCLLRR
jgi:hypothetical protein